jgi:ribose transport system permease protein
MNVLSSIAQPFLRAREAPGLRVSALRDYGIVVSFVTLFLLLTFTSDVFFSRVNLLNILDQNSDLGLVACGGTLVIIAGCFDLSVGAIFALSGVAAAQLNAHMAPGFALLVGALTGLGIGVGNGILVTVGRMNPLVATLGSSLVIAGLAVVMTNGMLVTVTDTSFSSLGQGTVFGIKYSIVMWGVFALACGTLLSRTVFGRYIYASGGNALAARLSGIRIGVVRTVSYAISGLSAGLAGVLVASRVSTGEADTGATLPLSAIAAIVIGGTSILGGEGAIWRTILGVLMLALIGNGFNLLGVNPIYQQILQGGIILAAVGLDAWARAATE